MKVDDELVRKELAELGLDERSFRAVALLPLIEVAWADHEIQPAEKKHILEVAKGHGLLSGRGAMALQRWLTERPTDYELTVGRRVLVRLARKRDGLGADLPEHALDTVVEMCVQVAEAAGGTFGLFWRVSPEEKDTIRAIADAIAEVRAEDAHAAGTATADDPWGDMLEELRTRDQIDLDALERQAADAGITGRPPESSEP
jgi:tellurite resistance protein